MFLRRLFCKSAPPQYRVLTGANIMAPASESDDARAAVAELIAAAADLLDSAPGSSHEAGATLRLHTALARCGGQPWPEVEALMQEQP